jgi:tetratricopeptide (TPR) repeat protein
MIFERLEELFGEAATVLERFELYRNMKDIDLPLRKIIYGLLQALISICALSLKVLNTNKLIKYLKVLAFNEDEGVKSELLKLRGLVEQEALMGSTLTYRNVREGFEETKEGLDGVRNAVDRLVEDVSRRENDSVEQRQLDLIKAKLGTDKDLSRQEEIQSRLWSEVVTSTGEWLRDDADFRLWLDPLSTSSTPLLLSAPQGFGKTFLCTTAVHEIQKQISTVNSTDRTRRNALAFYYLQTKDSRGLHGVENQATSLQTVLKTAATQFAQLDPVYRKHLAALCESWQEPDDVKELSLNLFDFCYRSNNVYWLVIDGIDRAGDKQLRELVSVLTAINARYSSTVQSCVRLLLSGRAATMEDLTRRLQKVPLMATMIKVAERSASDIASFISDRLDNMSLLQGDGDQIKKLRLEIFDGLVANAGGDYDNVTLLCREISTKQWPAQIRKILATMKEGNQRSDTIAREVERCNNTFAPQEIRDLNMLLLWVMSAKRSLRVSELNAVLFISAGENSLLPLLDQMRAKYSTFFHIDQASDASADSTRGWLVSLSTEAIRQYWTDLKSREHQRSDSQTIRLQEAEVRIVKRFLSSVCDEELYNKFGFEDFFAERLRNTSTYVNVDVDSASSALLLGCLQAVTLEASEITPLRDYSTHFFPKHMADVDLSMTDPLVKIECGRQLLLLFSDQTIIGRWWQPQDLVAKAQSWFYTDEYADLVLSFFRDTAITKTFTDAEKLWVKELTSKASPDADVLEHVARFLCHQILKVDVWDQRALFCCIAAYRSKLQQRRAPDTQRTAELRNYQAPSTLIVDVFTWLAEQIGVDISHDYDWNRALAELFAVFEHYEEALAQYQIAIPLSDDAWYAKRGLGIMLADMGKHQAGADVLEEVERQIVDGTAKQHEPPSHLRIVRSYMAWCYRQLGKRDEALAVYQKHIEQSDVTDYGFTFDTMRIFYDEKRYSEVMDVLRTMQKTIDPNFGIKRSSRLLHWMSDVGDFEMILVEAARATESKDYLQELFREAVADAHQPTYLVNSPKRRAEYRVQLKWFLSEELWRTAYSEESKQEAVAFWEELVTDASDVGVNWIYSRVAKRLAEVYTDRMLAHHPDSSEAQRLHRRITDLAVEDTAQQDAWSSTVNSNLLIARYMVRYDRLDEARRLVRGSVKVGLDLLTDEDPENDWEAFLRLASVLMYSGERAHALAAWSMLWPRQVSEDYQRKVNGRKGRVPLDGSSGTDKSSPAEEESDQYVGDLEFFCDGFCGTEWTYGDDIWVCQDCLDVMFCGDCHKKLLHDNLGENTCSPTHEFLYVPPFDASEARGRGKLKVRLDGKQIPVRSWLQSLRGLFDLEENAGS